jgi:uncharacterized Zn-binding protein involved in type VI secretion
MSEKMVVRVGDSTSHGGEVLEGHSQFKVLGKEVAAVGHRVSCPQCSGSQSIAGGAGNATIMGLPVALDGMKTTCGAVLIGSASVRVDIR